MDAGQVSAASKIQQQQLAGYVLQPYITYHRNRMRLSRLTADEVNSFRQAHPNLPGAQRIYWQWLERQAALGRWATFLKHYESTDSVVLQCQRLRALYATGEKGAALTGVAPLWTVGKSQPKGCDPIFHIWQRERLTEEMAWQRLRLAIKANQRLLARYLIRFFSGSSRTWARAYYDVHVNPSRVTQASRYRTDNAQSREVIAHGLRRLAASSVEDAQIAWEKYQQTHSFSDAERQLINSQLDLALAAEGLLDHPPGSSVPPEMAIGFANAYLKHGKWHLLNSWIEHLPEAEQTTDKWRYWHARSVDQTHQNSQWARMAYLSLAEQRSYYGFLAAQRLDTAISLNDSSKPPSPANKQLALEIPAVGRAIELFAVGDGVNARRELANVIPRLTEDERRAVAYLVQEIGYTTLAIHTANKAELRNDLELRFPVLHLPLFQRASHITEVPLPVLLSFARQESAFDAKARSPANALGILQMLPSTARLAARRAGLPTPSTNDLFDPAVNISLASNHIAWLLRRYEQVLVHVAAAYNAGENRVDRWLREHPEAPLDVWVESIPFTETRNYVKNVLAFSQVYGHLVEAPPSVPPDNEVAMAQFPLEPPDSQNSK